jgi:hypothetical protein
MLRKTMIILATAAALTAGLSADAFARGGGGGGGGHMGGGFGGGHIGGGFGGAHMGGGFARAPIGGGLAGARVGGGVHPHFAGRDRFGVGAGELGLYDNSCNYPWLYYNPDSCDLY